MPTADVGTKPLGFMVCMIWLEIHGNGLQIGIPLLLKSAEMRVEEKIPKVLAVEKNLAQVTQRKS